MKLYKIYFFCFLPFFFLSCQSQLDFLTEDGPQQESECIKKEVRGEMVCVEEKVEIFTVDELSSKSVDFLFILDVSPSMTDDLAHLGKSFESLMSQIIQSNWRMFFTTADHGDHDAHKIGDKIVFTQQKWSDYQGTEPIFGRFMNLEYKGKVLPQKYLDMRTPDFINVFRDTLTKTPGEDCSHAPYCQGSLEQPLRALKSVLERVAQDSSSGIREKADVISFIVTDEDERKEDPLSATTAQEVVETAKKLFPQKMFSAFSILIQDQQCLDQQRKHSPDSVHGKKVSELAELANGKNISLCEADYGPPLEDLSTLLRALIEGFFLAKEPISSEDIKVEFLNKKASSKNWRLRGKKVIFPEGLEPGLQIKVSYFVEKEEKE